MQQKQKQIADHRVVTIVRQKLADHYADAKTSLSYKNPYQLFVATVLSAQTTDQQVNKITAALFKAFPKVYDLATAEPELLEPYLKSCGLYRHKSRLLIAAGKIIVGQYGGEIPDNFEDLIKLPGVGRKTANVIISGAFSKPALAVDTHVFRVSKRIGLAGAGDVAGVEEQLKAVIPKAEWIATHHRLIRLGRSICHAREPACHDCFLPAVCSYARERGKLSMAWTELSVEELRLTCKPEGITFKTTEEVPPLEGMIGQERAVRATEFGLRIKKPGYNIFMTGLTGTGKLSYAQTIIEQISAEEPVPDDWIYVYNFEHPGEPLALNLPAGKGYAFCLKIQELLEDLKQNIPKAFDGEDYERQKTFYIKEFQEARAIHFEELTKAAQEQGFALKRTSSGFVTIPLLEGEQISEEEYAKLEQEEKDKLEKKSTEVQLKAMEIMRRVQKVEKELKDKLKELDQRIGLAAIGHLFNELTEEYDEFTNIVKYLNAYRGDVLSNIADFRGEDEEQQNPMLWLRRQSQEQAELRYTVNLLVDNRETKGAPLVYETNPSYYNLLGRVEYENRFGMVVTDFSMIKPGALHRANGGYLILQARDVLTAMQSWDVLKRVLRTREIRIENIGEHFGLVAMATLRPHPIPLNIKVVMIGNPLLYRILYHYDEDFRKLFKIKADFDVEMERHSDNIDKMAGFISYHCKKQGLRHFNPEAVAEIVEYSTRLVEKRDKLSTRFNEIVDLLFEADTWAELEGTKVVGKKQVQKALDEMVYRSNKYEQKVIEAIKDNLILLDLKGSKVGQVNALSVLDQGDYSFGRPSRITAATYLGRKGIINIERESDLSGKIHNKGVLILSGCIGMRYGSQLPINLTASVCFEQSYGGVDGDSASAAELICILSSLANISLRQDLALTGSVNQKGEIQPVGGINSKIEGFFLACRAVGLNGKQGVIIPDQNRKNLMLKKEVVDAVAKGKFHIYTIKTVDEGLELLSGLEAGSPRRDGSYKPGTFNQQVLEKLKQYNEALKSEHADQAGEEKGEQK